MAAYPFRKMTNQQLKKLLRDDQDHDESTVNNSFLVVKKKPCTHFPSVDKTNQSPISQQSESINQ